MDSGCSPSTCTVPTLIDNFQGFSTVNVIDAAAQGAGDGLHLSLNIAAMLIAFLSLIALVNGMLGFVHAHIAFVPGTLQQILGMIFAPLAWLMGVAWNDCASIGSLRARAWC